MADSNELIELNFGHLGNGLTVYNTKKQIDGDYEKIAHISTLGDQIRYYRKNLSKAIIDEIERINTSIELKHRGVILRKIHLSETQLQVIVVDSTRNLLGTYDADFDEIDNDNDIKMMVDRVHFKEISYQIISPDGFAIHYEPFTCDPADLEEHVVQEFTKWSKGFISQGYYSSNNGRIPLEDLADECSIEQVPYQGDDDDQLTDSISPAF